MDSSREPGMPNQLPHEIAAEEALRRSIEDAKEEKIKELRGHMEKLIEANERAKDSAVELTRQILAFKAELKKLVETSGLEEKHINEFKTMVRELERTALDQENLKIALPELGIQLDELEAARSQKTVPDYIPPLSQN